MKILITILLFFLCLNVNAKTITTPYLKVKEVDANYKLKPNEKIEKTTYYKQEKITKDFKYLERPNNIYSIKTNDLRYGEYTNYTKERLNDSSKDEDTKTIYYYQELKKINSLTIKNIKNLLITKISIKYKDNLIYEGNSKKISFNKKYSPEYLTLEITCFLNQEDLKGSFEIINSNYIKDNIIVTKKGYSKIKVKLINHLNKLLYEDKVLKTSNLEDKYYIKVLKEETLYRYRKKYYKCYKEEIITDKKLRYGYKVIEVINKYYLYKKETIELYDNIMLTDYLDLDKIIKSSTIPLSNLTFNYNNTCSKTNLTIKYQDFKVTTDITFKCQDNPKSKVHKGKNKSIKRELFAILFKTLFLRKL